MRSEIVPPMAESELIRAQRYHDRARDLRSLALKEREETIRRKLLDLAAQYEDCCQRILARRLPKIERQAGASNI